MIDHESQLHRMISKTYLARVLIACCLVALVSSCSEPEQSRYTGTLPGVEQVDGTDNKGSQQAEDIPAGATQAQNTQIQDTQASIVKPALNLSIQGLTDSDADVENLIVDGRHIIDNMDQQAQKLTRKKTGDDVKLSGKIFTDQAMIENKQYLDSVDGIQINIEGNFR